MPGTLRPVTGEIVQLPDPPRTLFHTDDPAEVLQAARTVAEALKSALDEGGMVQKIGPSEHVRIDGWQTLGSMLGIAPHVVWSRPIDGGWEARAEARTADGRTVGSAEAMCTHEERNWRRSDEYALRSMAQTRAMSKALRGPLGFIITLAGKSATPAEEIQPDTLEQPHGPPASDRDLHLFYRALQAIYGPEFDPTGVYTELLKDAGGYLPKTVARAVMRVAAHRPGRPGGGEEGETGAGTEEPPSAPHDPADPGQTPQPEPEPEEPGEQGEEVTPAT